MGTAEKLMKEAEELRKYAKQFEGCSFYGEWPGAHYLRQASLLEQAALEIMTKRVKHEK